jgi:hypothetical protein
MKVRIRESLDKWGNPCWFVETKGGLLPWWRKREEYIFKVNAEKVAQILANPEILEVTK